MRGSQSDLEVKAGGREISVDCLTNQFRLHQVLALNHK